MSPKTIARRARLGARFTSISPSATRLTQKVAQRLAAACCTVLDPLDAEHLHFSITPAAERIRHVGVQDQVLSSRSLARVVEPVEAPHLVGAVVGAVARTDAAVVDLLVEAFRALHSGLHGADVLAGGVVAMLTEHRHVHHVDVEVARTAVVAVDAHPVHLPRAARPRRDRRPGCCSRPGTTRHRRSSRCRRSDRSPSPSDGPASVRAPRRDSGARRGCRERRGPIVGRLSPRRSGRLVNDRARFSAIGEWPDARVVPTEGVMSLRAGQRALRDAVACGRSPPGLRIAQVRAPTDISGAAFPADEAPLVHGRARSPSHCGPTSANRSVPLRPQPRATATVARMLPGLQLRAGSASVAYRCRACHLDLVAVLDYARCRTRSPVRQRGNVVPGRLAGSDPEAPEATGCERGGRRTRS